MSDVKSAKAVAAEFTTAYAAVRPFEVALAARIREVSDYFKTFRKENKWYGETRFDFLDNFNALRFEAGSITDEGIYFYVDGDDYVLTFREIDNFKRVIRAEFNKYAAEKAANDAAFNAQRRATLEAELASLGN